jgi:predicted dehydrogenase
MLRETRPDFADIVTDVGTHAKYTKLAAGLGIPVVCQKPLAVSYQEAAGCWTPAARPACRFM